MKIQTFSVLVGSKACNAFCPFCVSKMTPAFGVDLKKPKVNWRNFEIGCKFAKDSGVSTVLLTGKGEPTLFPDLITEFLEHLRPYNFPFIELQTNGILLFQQKARYKKYLKKWYDLGLTMVAISIVHYENKRNQEIFQPKGEYMDLPSLISYLHSIGFSVRLSVVMFKGAIDNIEKIKNLIRFARKNGVEQLTIRPVRMPAESKSEAIKKWVSSHQLEQKQLNEMRKFFKENAVELLRLMHDATVYDYHGQNVCLTDCLTISRDPEEVRQLIFFPDGHLRYDWQYPGAILL